MKGIKVNCKPGTCNSWQDMDNESCQAVYLAERLVEGKSCIVIGEKRVSGCTLEIRYGRNLYGTQIYIADHDGLQVAFYSNGHFYNSISRQPVELI